MFTLRFDMRAPAFGADPAALYAAAPEMCGWAENHGCLAAVMCEHHGSEDGYLPSPLLLASAVAARTQRLALSLILILPFYDPVRLAEDMAVLDILSAWTGFLHPGAGLPPRGVRDLRAGSGRPRPAGRREAGAAAPAARRGDRGAGRAADRGDATAADQRWAGDDVGRRKSGRGPAGRAVRAGHAGQRERAGDAGGLRGRPAASTATSRGRRCSPTAAPPRSRSSQRMWTRRGRSSAGTCCTMRAATPRGTRATRVSAGFTHADTVDELREAAASHVIYSVPEAVSRVRAGKMLTLSPLCGGLPPEIAWPYLKRVGEVVLPEAARPVPVETA